MATQEEINRQKELNAELEKTSQLKRESLDTSSSLIDSLKETLGIQSKRTTFESAILGVNKKVYQTILDQKTELTDISSLGKQIAKNSEVIKKSETITTSLAKNLNETRKKEADQLIKKLGTQQKLEASIEAELKNAEKDEKINQNRLNGLKGRLSQITASIEKEGKSLNIAQQQYAFSVLNTKELEKQNKERAKELKFEKQVNKNLGITGALLKGAEGFLNKIGLGALTSAIGFDEINKELKDFSRELEKSEEKLSETEKKQRVMAKGFKLLGQSVKGALTDPLAQVTFFIDQLFKALKGSDAAAADMAKGLNMSYEAALSTRRELTTMANASLNNFVNTRGMQESLMAINTSLGTNVMLSEDMLVQFTEMREMAGFTNDELQSIAAISLTTGKSMNDVTGEFMAQAKISALQNGVLLNEKDLLKGIGQVSAATTLSLGKNPKLIGEAVATAKSLGMELSKVDDIANSLLQFEDSISSELEAELLLGRDINLEKARQAALNNDLATVAKEISEQTGTAAEFGAMNRIQQDAIAKSVGMNREDLAKTLFVQEQLTGLTGDAAKEQEDILNKRIEEVGLAQAQKELAEGGIEGLREQAGIADKFQATMEKLQELFVMLADPILVIVDAFSPILNAAGYLIGLIGELGKGASYFGELLTEWTSGLGIVGSILRGIGYAMVLVAGYGAFAALSPIPVVGPILGAAAAATIIGAGFSAINSSPKEVGDVMSPADGKTQISTKEGGLFELSKNDDLIAAPGAAARMKNGGSTTVIQQAPPPDNTESKRTNALLEKIANQSPVFKIGTDEFFTSTSKYSYQIQ